MTPDSQYPEQRREIPRWSDRLHRFFAFLASGGGTMLIRKTEAPPQPKAERPKERRDG